MSIIGTLSRKKFVIFDVLTNNVVGHLHRQTNSSYYYYPTVPKWKRQPTGLEKKIKKADNLILALAEPDYRGAFAFFGNGLRSRVNQYLNATLRMNNAHPVLDAKERLSLALGEDNFVLSLYAGKHVNAKVGIHSVMCNNSTDAMIANLIINQA